MPTDIYFHKHHIIPRHAGGTDAPDNIVRLTPEEHAEAHRLLYEEYGRWQDKLAWQGLAGHIGKEEIIAEKYKHRLGTKLTEEHKKKISEFMRGKAPWNKGKTGLLSAEHKRKLYEANKGRKHTEATKRKQSERMMGHIVSAETKKKMSEANTGENNPMYGKSHSAETKRKIRETKKAKPYTHTEERKRQISEAGMGRIASAESKKKMSEARKGTRPTEETRKKLSEGRMGEKNHMYGKVASAETLKKMSEALKRSWARRKAAEAAK